MQHFDAIRDRIRSRTRRSCQILGRSGELWGAMSGHDKVVVARAR